MEFKKPEEIETSNREVCANLINTHLKRGLRVIFRGETEYHPRTKKLYLPELQPEQVREIVQHLEGAGWEVDLEPETDRSYAAIEIE